MGKRFFFSSSPMKRHLQSQTGYDSDRVGTRRLPTCKKIADMLTETDCFTVKISAPPFTGKTGLAQALQGYINNDYLFLYFDLRRSQESPIDIFNDFIANNEEQQSIKDLLLKAEGGLTRRISSLRSSKKAVLIFDGYHIQ